MLGSGGDWLFECMFEFARKDDKLLLPLEVHSWPQKTEHQNHTDIKRYKKSSFDGFGCHVFIQLTTQRNRFHILGDMPLNADHCCIHVAFSMCSDTKITFGLHELSITNHLMMLVWYTYCCNTTGTGTGNKKATYMRNYINNNTGGKLRKWWKDQFISERQTEWTKPRDYSEF